MDYEKLYKEALEIGKALHKNGAYRLLMEEIFPELAESEENRIKRCIGMVLTDVSEQRFTDYDTSLRDCLAWLEKQGEPNPYSGVSFEYNGHIWGMCARDNGVDILLDKQLFKHLENQGANSVTITKGNYSVTNAEVVSHLTVTDSDGGKCTTASTTFEPEFKVGDWVAYNSQNAVSPICQITKVDGDIIGLKGLQGERFQTEYWDLNENYHLWTIQDAKDGDVLTNGKMIVIFKHFEEPSYRQHIVAYIGLDNNGNIQITGDTWNLGIDKAKPATKQQRDLLFQKMKEEGYEWDAEKKELKKTGKNCIADNSYETVKFPFKAKACGKIVTIHDGQLNGDGTKWIKYQSDDKDGFKIYLPEDLEPVENDSDIIEEGDPQPMSYGKELDEKMYKACELYNNGEYSQSDLFFAGVRAEYERAKKNVIEWKPSDNAYYDDICELLFNILRSERYNTINKDAIRNDLDWLISIKESLKGKQK